MTCTPRRWPRAVAGLLLALCALGVLGGLGAAPAHAAPAHAASAGPVTQPLPPAPPDTLPPDSPAPDSLAPDTEAPLLEEPDREPLTPEQLAPGVRAPRMPAGPGGPDGAVTVQIDDLTGKPSTPILVLLGLTLLSLVPAILLTCTSFTKVLIVLGLTRNALGLQQTPPNQVLAGLALFLSLFIMSPALTQMNDEGLQPYLDSTKTQTQAWTDGVAPLRDFMLDQTGDDELRLLTAVADRDLPENRDDVELTTLVPAFVLSELKQAFIIGFVIFIPFLVIDIVVSAALMSLGMMMMPPVMVSLPFKLLLFVLVDGWSLIIKSLVSSYG